MQDKNTLVIPSSMMSSGQYPAPPKDRFPVLYNLIYGKTFNAHPMQQKTHTFIVDDFFSHELSLWDGSFVFPFLDNKSVTVDTILGIPSVPPYSKSWIEWGNGTAAYVFKNDDGTCIVMSVVNMDFEGTFCSQIGLGWGRITYNDDGIADSEIDIYPIKEWQEYGMDYNRLQDDVETMVNLVSALFVFTHCKNVTVQESLPKRHEARAARRRGEAVTKYHSIVIDPHKTQDVAYRGERDDDHPKRALHLARGHFAHYTEDKPLFGKYTGTFWRPAHVRGSADAGVTYKDYRVRAPKHD